MKDTSRQPTTIDRLEELIEIVGNETHALIVKMAKTLLSEDEIRRIEEEAEDGLNDPKSPSADSGVLEEDDTAVTDAEGGEAVHRGGSGQVATRRSDEGE